MPAVKAENREQYFEASRTWEYDRFRAAAGREKLAWVIAAVAVLLAVVAVFAVAMLAPLKTVQPYVIRVDRSSGETQIVTALKGPQPRTYEDAVNRYFISQYVRLREGWLNDAARENAYAVMLMSDQNEAQRYLSRVQASNRNAPSNVYGDKGFVSIAIRSISFLSQNVAQVRYSKIISYGQSAPIAQNWNAILTFKYTTAPELEKDRNINPLGFQVVNYRSDPEA
ncbi:virB8 family protein [Sphingomonas carotinifaciens]|uniref:Conjugal transfer protein TraJ n=1 Tax=Sphingomonas carotinifaciens TaxID=1166323 RepID=A0A1G7Q275_9SPHN|nr:type IV secretion system protein [Sphingomonas carotinifaciens]MBB4087605.1 type IV secretion system protein VirB8 [Sphingomonas carotinifaciens]MWC45690.1 conjugal transfer protein TraJ [Sphingomonas carotinifaciens]SDF92687.1 type IV secretion system protein VirB8 [Sphingomonas carotinifaciens]